MFQKWCRLKYNNNIIERQIHDHSSRAMQENSRRKKNQWKQPVKGEQVIDEKK